MKTTIKGLRFGFLVTVLAIAGGAFAGCGGDDTSTGISPAMDASADATVVDGQAADALAPPSDAGKDAADAGPPICASGQTTCGDTCVDLTSNGDNCGACGNDCAPGTVCSAGACAVACNGGATQCGNSCVNLAIDPANCGVCGATCATGLVCSDFKCGGTCAAGLDLCTQPGDAGTSVDAGDGGGLLGGALTVCVDESADPNNCGGCGLVCPAGQLCSNGSCATSCQVGLVQCNGRCVDPTSNGDFCGATAGCGADAGSPGTVCASGQVCTTGAMGTGTCAITCASGQVNCGGTCIDPTSDRENCGALGDCVSTTNDTANSAGVSCATGQVCTKNALGKGTCAVSCVAGQIECGGTCIDPQIDPNFCGAVGSCVADGKTTGGVPDSPGTTCPNGQLCSKGACVPNCPVGQIDCGGKCVDPQTDNAFCGASGACTGTAIGTDCTKISGTICSASSCQLTCEAGLVDCNGICIDPTSDSAHCGVNATCGGGAANSTAGVCPSGTVCTAGTGGAGTCAVACAGSQVNCGGTCIDPKTSESHCGATAGCGTSGGITGTACPGGESCQNGSCSATCGGNLTACGSACVDETNDPSHCGTCTTVCNAANAVNVCRSKQCAIEACTAGRGDCDGMIANGCETSTLSDPNNCGACGNVCGAGEPTCAAGVCTNSLVFSETYHYEQGPTAQQETDFTTFQQKLQAITTPFTSFSLSGSNDTSGKGCSGTDADTICRALADSSSYTSVTCGGNTWVVDQCCGMEVTSSDVCDCDSSYVVRPTCGSWGGLGTTDSCDAPTQTITIRCGL